MDFKNLQERHLTATQNRVNHWLLL